MKYKSTESKKRYSNAFGSVLHEMIKRENLQAHRKPMIPVLIPEMSLNELEPIELDILEYEEEQIAKVLIMKEFEIFKDVKIGEYLNSNWLKRLNKSQQNSNEIIDLAPNIRLFTKRFNAVSNWVRWEILSQEDIKKRVSVIEKFIGVCYIAKQLNSFNTVMEIMSAFTCTPIFRLKKSWEAISSKCSTAFEGLTEFVESDNNYIALRTATEEANPPVLPYVGTYLSDLAFTDSNQSIIDGLINYKKLEQIGNIVLFLKDKQRVQYSFLENKQLRDYVLFENMDFHTNKDSLRISKKLEP